MALGRTPARCGLLLDQEAVIVVADDDGRGEARLGRQPLQRGGQEARRLVVEEADELLGVHGARQRPQPRARAAGENDWKNGVSCANLASPARRSISSARAGAQGSSASKVKRLLLPTLTYAKSRPCRTAGGVPCGRPKGRAMPVSWARLGAGALLQLVVHLGSWALRSWAQSETPAAGQIEAQYARIVEATEANRFDDLRDILAADYTTADARGEESDLRAFLTRRSAGSERTKDHKFSIEYRAGSSSTAMAPPSPHGLSRPAATPSAPPHSPSASKRAFVTNGRAAAAPGG